MEKIRTIGFMDLEHPKKGFPNRDQTGGFGSTMKAKSFIGSILSFIKKSKIRIPVLSLAYLNQIAKNNSILTRFYTSFPNGEDIIIIASSMIHYKYEIEVAKKIKKNYPDSKIGFIGPFASEYTDYYKDCCDFILVDEPEETFEKICKGKIKPKGIIKAENKIDVGKLPFPNWDGFDIHSYGYFPGLPKKPFLTIQGSRGCPFGCEFCPYLVSQGIPLRRRENENVINEIKYLKEKYKVKSLLFRDITWSMNKKLTKDLCRKIISEELDIEFGIETRLDTLDEELIVLMSEAGIKVVNLGIESPDDEILKKSGRIPIKESKIIKSIRLLEGRNIKIQAFYIIGLIDDNEKSIQKTIKYSHLLNTFTSQFCVLTPFPGTKTFQDLKDRIFIKDFSFYDEYTPVVKIDGISSERIAKLRDKAFSGYYLRPSWIIKHSISVMKNIFLSYKYDSK